MQKMWSSSRISSAQEQQTPRWNTRPQESIHSGQFMVSQFEADAEEDEDNGIAVQDPDDAIITELNETNDEILLPVPITRKSNNSFIDISLAKLFKCMNLAYK